VETDVLEYLKKNKADNINIINFIENYPIHYMERIGNSVCIKGVSDRNWIYISSKSSKELELIKNKLDSSDKNFAIIEDWMIPIITNGSKIKWKLSTMRLVLTSNETLPEPTHNMSELIAEDSKFIYENSDYKNYVSIEYIMDRIVNGISSCVRIMDKPVAWGITQDDGAIGFLHVLPEYRKSGYGRDITVDLINKVRNKGHIPFVHIEEKNDSSMMLAMSLGFAKNKIVNWLEVD
jgi:GNAT superfamily N-acetyltransferase